MKRPLNVLLSSVGRRSYLVRYFQDALAGCGKVLATNCIAHTQGMLAADEAIVVPAAYESDYIPTMLDICRTHGIDILFSLHDLEPPFLAPYIEEFRQAGTRLVLADPEFIDVCLDKYATAQFATRLHIHTPAVYLSPQKALEDIASGRISFPVILKPRYGFGSIGLQTARCAEDLEMRWAFLRDDILQSDVARVNNRNPDACVLIQEKLLGEEYGLDIINDLSGRFVTCIVEKKVGMRAGETDGAETVEDPVLQDLGKRIGECSGHPGVLDVDAFVKDGVPSLLEMNPRFGGHYPFAHIAGANIPAALVAWARNEDPDPSWLIARPGVRSFKDIVLVEG